MGTSGHERTFPKEEPVDEKAELAAVLFKAMQLERDGHAFYLAAAERTAAAAGRKMFLSLARDELQHLQFLDDYYRRHLIGVPWPSAEVLEREAGRRWPIFPPPTAAGEVVAPNTDDLQALRQAIAAEQASIDLYQHGLETATDPPVQALFRLLVQQEEGHRTILEGEYDYLTHTGFWFDQAEFNLEAME